MIRAPLSTTSVLDEATEVVGLTASPWAALLILTEIPYRFLQAVFVDQLIALGAEATHYGRFLQSSADLVIAAFVLAVAGRAVYARACRLASQSGANPGRDALRLSLPALLSFLVTSAVTELLFYAGSITVVAIPLVAVVRGLATGTYELNDAPGVLRPFRHIARYGREVRIVVRLVFVFAVALLVAFANVAASFSFGVALAGAAGVRAARWSTLFSFENRRMVLMTMAGALIVIQPFWIAANVLLVRKAGAEETGEDLRTWFGALRRADLRSAVAAAETVAGPEVRRLRTGGPRAVVAVLLFLAATRAGAMTVDEYAGALDRLRGLVESNQLDAARGEAKALIGQDVGGKFFTDRSLLEEVAALQRADLHVRERLLTTATELRRSSGITVPPGDVALLDRIHQQQTVAPGTPDGEVISPRLENMSLLQRLAEQIGKALRWVGEKLQSLFDWLGGFSPKPRSSPETPTSGMRWLVMAVVVLIAVLIIVLAVEVIRRSRKRVDFDALESEPISSRRDDDPLSRGANEWERYAAQLAAAGRVREAIRAWYHAVLVTLYAAGILTFRKGRTNWEIISALAPALQWRSDFVVLTRQFEHQWYGAERSPAEALDDVSRRARAILDVVRRGGA